MKLNNQIYRTANGGVVPIETDLSLKHSARIGNYSNIYSASSDNQMVFLGVSDYVAPDTVYIHDEHGNHIRTLGVDALPGDFEIWGY